MKLISSFFSSSASASSSSATSRKKKKGSSSKERSMSRSDTPSFGSSASSGGSDSFARVTARGTPRTVIIGRNASGLDAEYWSSTSPGHNGPKMGVVAPVAHAAAAIPAAVSELFGVFDRDGDGKITKEELELVLRRLGTSDPPSEEEVAMMVAEVDRDGDGCISLDEFRALGPALGSFPASGTGGGGGGVALGEEELRDAFAIFDADGDGKISAEELLGIFLTLGDETCTLDDCRRMIGGVDSRGDGFVCFDDFVRMMDSQR